MSNAYIKNDSDDMDVVSFKFRLKEFIKAKLLPNNTIDDDMDQIWQEVVSQVSFILVVNTQVHKYLRMFSAKRSS